MSAVDQSHQTHVGAARDTPDRAGVSLRPRGVCDALVARRLEREARRLIDGGERRVVIDLRAVDRLKPGISATLWAIHRYGRARRAQVSVVLGDTPAACAIDRAGLLAGLIDRPPESEIFFDWTR